MLETRALTYSYPNGPAFSFPDILGATLEPLLITGASGTGKTTLLHLLGGLLKPQSGKIEIAGTEIQDFSESKRDSFRAKMISIIFQKSFFLNALNVNENIRSAAFFSKSELAESQIDELLSALNISDKKYSAVSELSIGEQQRVSIARALVKSPKLILADEPTSALDDQNCDEVISLLTEQADKAGAKLIIVTHDQRLKDHFTKSISL